mmetsp:Transcript_133278/g.242788  ORF Transcript_133278/g.242788 Transcript_133278/m.242788 type:complete len:418 (-) Transcript_133278:17-1270(-)
MHTRALVLACLAWTGLASRVLRRGDGRESVSAVQMHVADKPGDISLNSNRLSGFVQLQSSWRARACSSLKIVQMLFLVANPRATFNPSGASMCFPMFKAIHQGGVSRAPLVRMDEFDDKVRLIDDPYKVLDVPYDATRAQVKKAWQKKNMEANTFEARQKPDNDDVVMRLRAAYDSLFKSELRKKWDRKLGVRGSSRASSSTGTYRSPSYSSTSSSSRGYADPFEQFKSAEAQQRWREENPTPEELGDSFGELFNDFANAVGKAVVGSGRDGGDWSSVMNEVGGMSQSGLESLLVSRDRERLENELESTKLVQETLKSRIERLKTAVSDSESDLERFRRQKSSATSSMSRSFESDLEKDVRRQREQLQDARKSLERQQTNAERIQLRIAELVRAGSTRSPGTSSEPCYSGSGSSSRS